MPVNTLDMIDDGGHGLADENAQLRARLAEQNRELAYSREFIRSLVEANKDLVLSVDDANQITFSNRGFLGAAATGLVGRSLLSLVDESSREEFADACTAVRQGVEAGGRVEAAGAGPLAGHWCHFSVSLLRVNGGTRGLSVIVADVTELNEAWGRIRSAEKLVATGRMAARIAHEINNPLAGMAGAMQLIKTDIDPAAPTHRYVLMVEREITRISGIVRQMFGLYRPEQEPASLVDLRSLVDDVVTLMTVEAAKRGIRLVNGVTASQPVRVQDQNLRQVLINILRNAIEVTRDGGEVVIGVERHGRCVDLLIDDEGPGISQELLDQMFEPFFTTKETSGGRGLGLGLSISDALLKAMGGSIGFENRATAGARCKICLPEAGRTQGAR